MSYEQTGFYDKSDLRSENRELALKMVFREIREFIQFFETPQPVQSCSGPVPPFTQVLRNILNRWKIREEEIWTRLSLAISFPEGVVRNQWFYDEKGQPYSKKHDGRPLVVKKKPAPKKKR